MSILAKVDFPDDFGPQIIMAGGSLPLWEENLDKAWFHSGAETMGCKKAFGGPSLDVNSYFTLAPQYRYPPESSSQFEMCSS